jgi:hypothetical protein
MTKVKSTLSPETLGFDPEKLAERYRIVLDDNYFGRLTTTILAGYH